MTNNTHNRLTIIALELGALNGTKFTLGVRLAQLREDYEARKMAITPGGGWQGKNAEERKFAESIACAADEVLKKISDMMTIEQHEFDGTIITMENRQTERRALEWTLRAKLIDALAGNYSASEAIALTIAEEKEADIAMQDAADEMAVAAAESTMEIDLNPVMAETQPPPDDEEEAAAFFGREPIAPSYTPQKPTTSQEELPF